MITIGTLVRFKFGKQPISAEHKRMAARRGHSIGECARIDLENEAIVWEDLYAVDKVSKIDGEYCWVGNVRDGYRIHNSELKTA